MQTKTIGDHTYTMRPLSVRDAREVTFRVGKAVAKGGRGAGGGTAAMLIGALDGMAFEDLQWLFTVHEKYCTVEVNGKEPQLSDIAASWWLTRQGDSMAWLLWVVEETCGPFFRGLMSAVVGRAAALEGKDPPSPSPPPSTGSSGGP